MAYESIDLRMTATLRDCDVTTAPDRATLQLGVGIMEQSRESTRLFEEASLWLAEHRGCVSRTHMPSGEHVAVVLPNGVSVQFMAEGPGEFEEGIVLAVDEIRG